MAWSMWISHRKLKPRSENFGNDGITQFSKHAIANGVASPVKNGVVPLMLFALAWEKFLPRGKVRPSQTVYTELI